LVSGCSKPMVCVGKLARGSVEVSYRCENCGTQTNVRSG
jgi:hypothetical protein